MPGVVAVTVHLSRPGHKSVIRRASVGEVTAPRGVPSINGDLDHQNARPHIHRGTRRALHRATSRDNLRTINRVIVAMQSSLLAAPALQQQLTSLCVSLTQARPTASNRYLSNFLIAAPHQPSHDCLIAQTQPELINGRQHVHSATGSLKLLMNLCNSFDEFNSSTFCDWLKT